MKRRESSLDSQAAGLTEVRNRTVSLLSAALLFVSFAAGLGLINTDHNAGRLRRYGSRRTNEHPIGGARAGHIRTGHIRAVAFALLAARASPHAAAIG